MVRFGLGTDAGCADVWGDYERHVGGGRAELTSTGQAAKLGWRLLSDRGRKIENAVAAAAACYAAGLPMDECLRGLQEAAFTPSRGDLEPIGDWLVIDDTYNANPAAVRASLDELVRLASDEGGRPVAVLGDMLELGPESAAYHQGWGRMLRRWGCGCSGGSGRCRASSSRGSQMPPVILLMRRGREETDGSWAEAACGHVGAAGDLPSGAGHSSARGRHPVQSVAKPEVGDHGRAAARGGQRPKVEWRFRMSVARA